MYIFRLQAAIVWIMNFCLCSSSAYNHTVFLWMAAFFLFLGNNYIRFHFFLKSMVLGFSVSMRFWIKLKPLQSGGHFSQDIFKSIFNKNVLNFKTQNLQICLEWSKYVTDMSTSVQNMNCHRGTSEGQKPRQRICSTCCSGCHHKTWWRHQMETFPAWLALCAGNSLVTGEFP